MTAAKTPKELAFLHDLYIAPGWGERFAQLIDEHVAVPDKGAVLYIGAATGAHALAIAERAGTGVRMICLDESEERLEIARAKAAATKLKPEFYRQQPEALDFDDDTFDLVVADASMLSADRLPEVLAEMARVTVAGGRVAINLPTASSFGEFFPVYWEALFNSEIPGHEHDVETLVNELPTVSDMEGMAREAGLEKVESWTRSEQFNYPTAKEFFDSPLVANFLLDNWMDQLADESDRNTVMADAARIIDDERNDIDFVLTVKATLVSGRKPK